MAKYLSQRAILENIRASNDSALHAFGELIMNGAFDVDVSTFGFVQEKDAEISKLKQALSLQCDDTLKERQEVIRLRQEENIRRMNSSVPARDPKQDSVYQRLERLEKGQKDLAQGLLGEVSSHKQYLTDLLNCDRRIKALEARPVTYPQPTPYPWNQFWYTSTTAPQFNPCQNCQTIKDFNAQHPSGFVGDSPCATCPNNPYRVTCSK